MIDWKGRFFLWGLSFLKSKRKMIKLKGTCALYAAAPSKKTRDHGNEDAAAQYTRDRHT